MNHTPYKNVDNSIEHDSWCVDFDPVHRFIIYWVKLVSYFSVLRGIIIILWRTYCRRGSGIEIASVEQGKQSKLLSLPILRTALPQDRKETETASKYLY